jgi:hypothetical protein
MVHRATGFCEHCNEPSGFIKNLQYLNSFSNYWPLKKGLVHGAVGPRTKFSCLGFKSLKYTQDLDVTPISCTTAIALSSNIIMVIKSESIKRAEHVARMGDM